MSDAPSILVVTSSAVPSAIVTPVLAALQAGGASLRAFDGGDAGLENGGAIDWVMRAIGGDDLGEQLTREVESFRPDALVCFEARSARVACDLRERSARPFPVLAIVSELAPSATWAESDADRYFVVDDEAAVHLEDTGVVGDRILPVGAIGEYDFAAAGALDQSAVKSKFGITGRVVLVQVEGLGAEESGQLALQLSLVKGEMTFLFDAGTDTDAAAALRVQVPVLDMKAKLFGETEDAALLWRCADVIVAQADSRAIGRALVLGAKVVCLSPQTGAQSHLANALEERGRGAIAANTLMVGSAIERLIATGAGGAKSAGLDGAAAIADAAYLIGVQREDVVDERQAAVRAGRKSEVADASQYAAWAAKAAKPAGGLEDLGGSAASGGTATRAPTPIRPDASRLRRLLEEIEERKKQVSRTIADATKQAAVYDLERAKAEKLESSSTAKHAERNADLERARMHSALAEMAGLQEEERSLLTAVKVAEAAPPARSAASEAPSAAAPPRSAAARAPSAQVRPSVAEELDRLRRQAGEAPAPKKAKTKKRRSTKAKSGSAVDDELAALKRKMAQKRRGS